MAGFRARARTVDMLGRQQIAGIPTAISELFKNAHDAYASRVDADFLRPQGMWVLRDDGLGMTREDFEERWLVLGTDSKVGSSRGLSPPPRAGRSRRPVLGEKGIGRLAIASIGAQVLVLSRARRGRSLSDTTVALVNWRLYELPGVNLDQISVPLLECEGGTLPDQSQLARMRDEAAAQLDELNLEEGDADAISSDLACLEFSPAEVLDYLGKPSLTGSGHGTQFIVIPAGEQLEADLEEIRSPDGRTAAPPLVRTLIGFSNTMVPAGSEPVIKTAFRDRRAPGDEVEVLGGGQFFTPDEFASADHHVSGRFGADGAFDGQITIYGRDPEPLLLPYGPGAERETECGPFRLDFAYVQGEASQSRLEPTLYADVTRKLDRIGGLYVYRDGIRVLPYGTPDFDFLGFEQRRSLNAGRYFFSYRRMFGAIGLTRAENEELQEKAGREGFRENRAYRDFKGILVNFFIQVAADYFSVGAERDTDFAAARAEAAKRYERRRALDKRTKARRGRFAAEVGRLIEAIGDGAPARGAEAVRADLGEALDAIEPGPGAGDQIVAAEIAARQVLDRARSAYRLRAPGGVPLTTDIRRDFDHLGREAAALEKGLWMSCEEQISEAVQAAAESLRAEPDRQQRLLGALEIEADEGRAELKKHARNLDRALDDAQAALHRLREHDVEQAEAETAAVIAAASDISLAVLDDSAFVTRRVELEEKLETAVQEASDRLSAASTRLQRAVALSVNGTGHVADEDAAEIFGEEVLELREQAERDFELTQLGMATQVISHELDASVTSVRDGLRQLYAWADINSDLGEIYEDIRTSFEHLDGYLTLFTPLQRRLRRRREELSGPKIERFLRKLFDRRLEGSGIVLETTDAFSEWTTLGFRSVLYPVLINLVDNAAYWVRQRPGAQWIRLDAGGDALLVADSGPGIPARDRERIFDFGFTRKPAGRGAGLHISREVLTREGGYIGVVDSTGDEGATFRIELAAEGA